MPIPGSGGYRPGVAVGMRLSHGSGCYAPPHLVSTLRLEGVHLRDLLTTLGELAGGSLIVIGAWQFYQPLGFVTAGLVLAAVSWLADR